MLFNRKRYDIRRDGITQSLLTKFMRCPLMGIYSTEGWRPKSLIDRVRFGNICHHVCECLYKAQSTMDLKWVVDGALEEWERRNWDPGEHREDRFELDMAKAEACMHQYVYAYPGDFVGDKTFKSTELTLRTEFAGFRIMGKIDAIYKDKHEGLWLMETKTKARIQEEKLLQTLPNDFQNQFYLTLYETQTGRKVNGILYNIIRNPSSKPSGLPLLAYKTRLNREIGAKRPHFFKRYELNYTDADRDRFRAELIDKLAGAERALSGRGSVWRNETACWDCDFKGLCIDGDEGPYTQKPLFQELD